MFSYLLFDLDGTISDPKQGICGSVQYALQSFGIEEPDLDKLEPFIGPPLEDSFMQFYHFDKEQAQQAIEKYRERFSVTGKYENVMYPGMAELLRDLQASGAHLAVASSKPLVFVEDILCYFGIRQYFEIVVGSGLDGSLGKKEDVVAEVLRQFAQRGATDPAGMALVGDRKFDVEGAKATGMHSIGVSYGYAAPGELEEAGAEFIVRDVEGLRRLLLGRQPGNSTGVFPDRGARLQPPPYVGIGGQQGAHQHPYVEYGQQEYQQAYTGPYQRAYQQPYAGSGQQEYQHPYGGPGQQEYQHPYGGPGQQEYQQSYGGPGQQGYPQPYGGSNQQGYPQPYGGPEQQEYWQPYPETQPYGGQLQRQSFYAENGRPGYRSSYPGNPWRDRYRQRPMPRPDTRGKKILKAIGISALAMATYYVVVSMAATIVLMVGMAAFGAGEDNNTYYYWLNLANAAGIVAGFAACFGIWQKSIRLRSTRPVHKLSLIPMAILAAALAMGMNGLLTLAELYKYSPSYQEVAELQGDIPIWLGVLSYGILAPLGEETVFRGVVYGKLKKISNVPIAALLSGLIFGLFHGNLVQAVYATVLGVVLALVYELYDSIWFPMLFHGIANLFVYFMIDLTGIGGIFLIPVSALFFLAMSAVCLVLMVKWQKNA